LIHKSYQIQLSTNTINTKVKILVTGSAGFIGFHVVNRLLKEGIDVIGLDNLNSYYSVELKKDRLREVGVIPGDFQEKDNKEKYLFYDIDLDDRYKVEQLFINHSFDVVIHLAAQAGVRYSLENPHSYIDSNISGFLNIIEGCRHQEVEHLIYASSSSVYGDNKNVPFKTSEKLDKPVSLYAATKKANELMAYTYSHLYDIPATGLRFFTVYGPWGRPDMAYFKFAELMYSGKVIDIYNKGEMYRDFTFIDDIVESIQRLISKPPVGENPNQIFNIGYGSPVNLLEFISILEKNLGIQAKKNYLPMQPGDVPRTWADTNDLQDYISYKPTVALEEGIEVFVKWFKKYRQYRQSI
jgi:UDP-glucuronate 4-epimerase